MNHAYAEKLQDSSCTSHKMIVLFLHRKKEGVGGEKERGGGGGGGREGEGTEKKKITERNRRIVVRFVMKKITV